MEKGTKQSELAKKIVNGLKEKDLLEAEAVSVLRKSISIIEDLKDQHKLR